MTEEIWKPIEGYEGLYEVSSYGRVRSLDRYDSRNHFRKGKLLKNKDNGNGYLLCILSKNGIVKNKYIHRLVAEAFIERPDGLYEVNHKDEDKTNNSVDNLEWCDRKYNITYGTARIRSINTKIKNGYVNEENVGLSKEDYYKKWLENNKDYHKKWMENNKDYYKKWLENNKDYYKKWLENNKDYYKKWRENNKDYHKDYYEKNKEKLKDYHHQYYLKRKAGL